MDVGRRRGGITPETTKNINQVNFTGNVPGFLEYKYGESASLLSLSLSALSRPRFQPRELNVPCRIFRGAPRSKAYKLPIRREQAVGCVAMRETVKKQRC